MIFFAIAAFVLSLGSVVFLGWLVSRLEKKIETLESQLSVFVDTSINVARSVDSLVNAPEGNERRQPAASRRWILGEARERMARGQPVEDIAVSLKLSSDETSLLEVSSRAH